jgi:hypothetical protein
MDFAHMGLAWKAGGGCCSLLWFLFTVFAIVHIVSSRASVAAKVCWIVLCLVVPYLGPILWLLLGPRQHGY